MNKKFSLELDNQNQTDNILALYKDMALDGDSQVIQCFSELNFPINGRLAANEYSFLELISYLMTKNILSGRRWRMCCCLLITRHIILSIFLQGQGSE